LPELNKSEQPGLRRASDISGLNQEIEPKKPARHFDPLGLLGLRAQTAKKETADKKEAIESKFKNGYLRVDKVSSDLRRNPVYYKDLHISTEKRKILDEHIKEKFLKSGGKYSAKVLHEKLSANKLKFRDIPQEFGHGSQAKEKYRKFMGRVFGQDVIK